MKRITRREALKLGTLAGGWLLLPIGLERRSYAKTAGSPVTISRSYRLALSTGEPLIVIGTDAGLMSTCSIATTRFTKTTT